MAVSRAGHIAVLISRSALSTSLQQELPTPRGVGGHVDPLEERDVPRLAFACAQPHSTQQPTHVSAEGSVPEGEPVVTIKRCPTRAATAPLRGCGNGCNACQLSLDGVYS
jgi:hypothetical protein